MIGRGFRLFVIGTAVLSAAGCSDSKSASTPLSPSTLTAPPGSSASTSSGGATVSGVVTGGSGMTVTVAGTTIGTTIDSAGRFALTNVPAGDIELRFSNAGVDAVLAIPGIADADQIELDVTVSGANATVTTHQRRSDRRIELKGLVSGLGGACPDATFTVNGMSVVTNGATRYEDGACSAVQNGTRVEVKGTRQANGSVLASYVDIDTPEPPKPDVRLDGLIAGLGGACPERAFTVNGTSVVTNSATRYQDGACGTLGNGTRVQVKGLPQSNGSVLASEIDIDTPEPPRPDVRLDGLIAGLGGACPNRTFTVTGTTVVTSSATRYEDGVCGTLGNGTLVQVKGTRQPNGSVLAGEIDIDTPEPPKPDVRLDGIIGGLGGACPNRTFTVTGTTVVTNSATRYEDGVCGTLGNGTRVQVRGLQQSNGSVLADSVDIDEPDTEVELKGAVSGLGGGCPALTFTVTGTAVATNGATRYDDGACGTIQNGTRVEVKGTRQPNGSVLANKIDIDR